MTKNHPTWVYQLEEIKKSFDLRTTQYVTIGMFTNPQTLRDRVYYLTKVKAFAKHPAWQAGKNDNEFIVRHGDTFYRYTRHCLIKQ